MTDRKHRERNKDRSEKGRESERDRERKGVDAKKFY